MFMIPPPSGAVWARAVVASRHGSFPMQIRVPPPARRSTTPFSSNGLPASCTMSFLATPAAGATMGLTARPTPRPTSPEPSCLRLPQPSGASIVVSMAVIRRLSPMARSALRAARCRSPGQMMRRLLVTAPSATTCNCLMPTATPAPWSSKARASNNKIPHGCRPPCWSRS